MKDYLSDIEVAKIEAFNADTVMVEAVKKVILEKVYTHGVMEAGKAHNSLRNRALVLVDEGKSDEMIGSQLRAFYEGMNAVEVGFTELSTIKSKVEFPEELLNEAI